MAVPPSSLGRGETVILAALLASVAFAFSPSLESQFTLPKLASFYSGLVGFALVWAVRSARSGTAGLPLPVAGALMALAGWWILSFPFAVHHRTALWGAVGRGNGLVLHLSLLAFFAGIASMRVGLVGVRRLLQLVLAVLVLVSAYAILQAFGLDRFVWPNVRPGSTIGHPVPLGAILAAGAPVAFALALEAHRPGALALTGIATSVIVFALGTTLSRGPWIGAACGLGVTVALALRGRIGHRARTLAFAGATAVVIAGTIWMGRVPGTRVTQRLALLTRLTTDPSFMNRFEYFSAGLAMVRQRPLIGAGFESFGLLFPPLRPVEAATVDEDTIPTMVHNGPLQTAVSTGTPGLLLFVALNAAIAFTLLPILRDRTRTEPNVSHPVACGILGALIAFWIQDLSGWEEISSSVFFWTIAGSAVALRASTVDADRSSVGPRWNLTAALAVAAAVLFATVSWTMWREVRVDRALRAAGRASVRTDWQHVTAELEAVRPLIAHDAANLDRLAVLYLNRMRVAADERTYRTAVDILRGARANNSFDPYILVHIVDLETLALVSRIVPEPGAESLEAASRATAMDPNNASVREAVARFYVATGAAAEALDEVRTARTLRPRRRGLLLLEGDILRALGDRSGSLEAYRAEAAMHADASDVWLAAQQKVTAALIEAGDYASALREAELLTSKAPADPIGWRLLDAARR